MPVAAALAAVGPVPSPTRLARRCGLDRAALDALCIIHRQVDTAGVVDRARLERAIEPLLESEASVDAIAAGCGAGSAKSLDALFMAAFGVTARSFRDSRGARRLRMELPVGFRAGDTLSYLGRDAASPTQTVTGQRFALAMSRPVPTGTSGALRIDGEVHSRHVELHLSARGRVPANAGPHALMTISRMFGLGTQVRGFAARARRERDVARLHKQRPGLRIPRTANAFNALTWSIVGQQISLPFAYQLTHALADLAGQPAPGGMLAPPDPAALADVDPASLRKARFSRAKAEYLTGCAQAVASGALPLEFSPDASAQTLGARLHATRGLGPWSVNYILMRGFGLPDCAPIGDAGLRRALAAFHGLDSPPDDADMARLMTPFSPHRSLATFHLWRSLDPASPL